MEKKPFKIVLYTPVFYPGKGGVEKVTQILINEWKSFGHEVIVITPVEFNDGSETNVYRNINFKEHRKLINSADIYILNVFTVKGYLPSIFTGKPIIAIHHTYYDFYSRKGKGVSIRELIKNKVMNSLNNIAVSRFALNKIGIKGVVIPNTYESDIFFTTGVPRTRDFIFVGRLVSDKGGLELIEALGILCVNENYTITIIGSGPEKELMENRSRELGIYDQIRFTGALEQDEIAQELNQHKVMVVPSVWDEPFGIVALEGLACGCKVVVSNRGGLPEAVEKHGWLLENLEPDYMAGVLKSALNGAIVQTEQIEYLKKFHKVNIAQKYLNEMNKLVNHES